MTVLVNSTQWVKGPQPEEMRGLPLVWKHPHSPKLSSCLLSCDMKCPSDCWNTNQLLTLGSFYHWPSHSLEMVLLLSWNLWCGCILPPSSWVRTGEIRRTDSRDQLWDTDSATCFWFCFLICTIESLVPACSTGLLTNCPRKSFCGIVEDPDTSTCMVL